MVYTLTPIPPDQVSAIWPYVREFVEKAVSGSMDYTTANEVYLDLVNRRMTLCTISGDKIEAIVCVEIHEYEGVTTASVALTGGSGAFNWLKDIGQLEEWCASVGADELELTGRTAWQRMLPEYEQKAVVLTKVLHG
jgi:hypothetical protein|tara:strand:- start:762 stop:1172 length:411 start_codon:yes stop_codon:yes gene_type:complete